MDDEQHPQRLPGDLPPLNPEPRGTPAASTLTAITHLVPGHPGTT